MSLPWFKSPTQAVLVLQMERITEGRTATKMEAVTEIAALRASGRLITMSLAGLASILRWNRGKVRRLVRDWPWTADGQEMNTGVPTWWTAVFEKKQVPAKPSRQETDSKQTGDEPHGRDTGASRASLMEKTKTEIEKETLSGQSDEEPSPEVKLYKVWQSFHPRASPSPNPKKRKYLRTILAETEGLEAAVSLMEWVHLAKCRWARQLRGEEPWPDGECISRSDLQSLTRSITKRLAQAQAWEDRNRAALPAAKPANARGDGADPRESLRRYREGRGRSPPAMPPNPPAPPDTPDGPTVITFDLDGAIHVD